MVFPLAVASVVPFPLIFYVPCRPVTVKAFTVISAEVLVALSCNYLRGIS
jgi:hypothetical protein